MTLLGAVFAVAFLVALVVRPSWLLVVLSVAVPFQNTAMIVLGPSSVTIFWGGVLVICLRLAWLLVQPAPARLATGYARGFRLVLAAFVVYAVVISLLGPFLFEGMPVYVPRYGVDDQVLAQGTLHFGVSNVAQLVYVGVAVALVAYVMLEKEIPRDVVAVGLVVGIALALVREAVGTAWPSELFENMPNIWYSIWETRARGTFAEPSGLAAFLAAGFGYFAGSLTVCSTRARWWHLAGLAATLLTYALAKAGTGLSGITGVLVIGTVTWFVRSGVRPVRLPAWSRPAAALGLVAAVVASPLLYALTVGMVQQKQSTQSAIARSAADSHAVKILFESRGLGVGLGSNRPSSLVMLLLSNVGLVGTALFVGVVVMAAVGGFRNRATRPYTWALVAALAAGISSKPDLSEPMLWLLVALCARSGADAELRLPSSRALSPRRPGVPRRPFV